MVIDGNMLKYSEYNLEKHFVESGELKLNDFSYVNIINKNGNVVECIMVNSGEFLDVSKFAKDGFIIKLYTDENLTEEFDYNATPINENIDLYLKYVKAPDNMTWFKDTDSGYYIVNDKRFGMIRFLFAADTNEEVSAFGIKYSKASDIDETIDSTTKSGEGDRKAFYGDLVGITDDTIYYAVAYIKIGDKYYWSDVASSMVNWNKKLNR